MATALPGGLPRGAEMSGKTLRRKIAVLAVFALLAVSGAEAGVWGGSPSHAAAQPVTTWNLLLERLWTLLTRNFTKAGCTIDPSGANCPRSQSPKNGCTIDPDGVCGSPSPAADAGCTIDPDGHCSK